MDNLSPQQPRWTVIPVDEFSPVVPFCQDVSEKTMKLGHIENINGHDCVVFLNGTVLRDNLRANDLLLCVLSEDNEVVRVVARVQYRNNEFVFLDSDNMHITYDEIFRFYRNGTLELTLKNDETFCLRYSDRGNPFVYASHGVAIDEKGYLQTTDDTFHRYNRWNTNYFVEPYPEEKKYLFAVCRGRAGITLARKAVYEDQYLTGIPDPVVDIALNSAGLWALTTKGQVYLADVEKSLEAVCVAEDAVAISNECYEQHFVYTDTVGNAYVYDCYAFRLKSDGEKKFLQAHNRKEYAPKVFPLGRGRLSELCVHEGELAFRCLFGGRGIVSLYDGRPVGNRR